MSIYFYKFLALFFLGGLLSSACGGNANSMMPAAARTKTIAADNSKNPSAPVEKIPGQQTAVFAGGCFWGVEAVFEHVKGVNDVTSGYAGGTKETADYDLVSGGETDHAEAVEVTFDSAQVSYEQLLKVFFAVAHNPTTLNRQGSDTGKQYRSAIFYQSDEQKRLAEKHIAELSDARVFPGEIVTEINRLEAYFKAEDYHQDYLAHHPNQPYIVIHDRPKIVNLQKQFPELYVSR